MVLPTNMTRRPKLGDILVEAKLISEKDLKRALRYQDAKDVKLGEALIALQLMTKEKLDGFLNNQRRKLLMGDLLVKAGKISFEQLQEILKEQKRTGARFGEALIDLGFMNEVDFGRFLAARVNVTFLDLSTLPIQEETVKLMDEESIRRLRALPVKRAGGGVLVGMVDPTDLLALDEVSQTIRRPVEVGLIMEKQMRQVLDRIFRKTGEIQGLMQELGEEMNRNRVDLSQFVQSEIVQDAPVVKIIQTLFEDAVRRNASDIHVEPGHHVLRIRKRIDGVLHEQVIREKSVAIPLLSKLKLMAGLEISERRLSQDGRFSLKVDDFDIDMRLSTMPTQSGESAVMRIFNQSSGIIRLNQMGFPHFIIDRLNRWIHSPHGVVLVTGPTGSGKTTTLYSALAELNTPAKKIITVEDPVEFRMDRINQVQVNNKIGLTFASILRTVLRQDPDIVLVGEMRDEETTDIAIRASLTGHLVLSTLHTNDAPSTIIRLFEMGTKGFAVASSVLGVLAQRLVKKVCVHCKTDYQPTAHERAWLKSAAPHHLDARFVRGAGCEHCMKTGYSGRLAVGEILEVDDSLTDAIRQEDTVQFMTRARQQKINVPLPLAALEKAVEGVTSLEESISLGGDLDWEGLEEGMMRC